jgi:hypothetical protein
MDLNSLGSFDANQHAPKQLGAIVPPGKWPFVISNTEIVPTKAGDGGMFVVTFNTPHGTILMRYNLWNQNPKTVEIAHGQLSALCHATGVFKVNWQTNGAELRNAQGMIDVALQDPDKPDGYTEVKKVYDKNGNEPGKAPAAAPQPQGNGAAWGGAQQPAAQPQATQPAWGATQAQQPQQPTPAAPQGWQQGPSAPAGEKPPWAK